jgi:hypothetical protein
MPQSGASHFALPRPTSRVTAVEEEDYEPFAKMGVGKLSGRRGGGRPEDNSELFAKLGREAPRATPRGTAVHELWCSHEFPRPNPPNPDTV